MKEINNTLKELVNAIEELAGENPRTRIPLAKEEIRMLIQGELRHTSRPGFAAMKEDMERLNNICLEQNNRLGELQMRICELEAYKPRDDNDAQLQDVYPDDWQGGSGVNRDPSTKMSAFVPKGDL